MKQLFGPREGSRLMRVDGSVREPPRYGICSVELDGPNSAGGSSAGPVKRQIRVLILDDELMFTASIERTLNRSALFTFTCTKFSGKIAALDDGLKALDADPLPFDLIISDREMGASEMDGLKIINKAREKSPDIPIIILSGHLKEEQVIELLGAGANIICDKPLPVSFRTIVENSIAEPAPSA